jgi:hypothetical protein
VEVPVPDGGDRYVIRLDSVRGQIVEVKMQDINDNVMSLKERKYGGISVAGFSMRSRMVGSVDLLSNEVLMSQLRLVKPIVPKALPTAGRLGRYDPVLEDIRAVPAVVEQIVNNWRDGVFSANSKNRITAARFSEKLSKAMASGPNALHLLVVGMEVYTHIHTHLYILFYIPHKCMISIFQVSQQHCKWCLVFFFFKVMCEFHV